MNVSFTHLLFLSIVYSLVSIMFISEGAHYYDLFLAVASALAIPFILLSISYASLYSSSFSSPSFSFLFFSVLD